MYRFADIDRLADWLLPSLPQVTFLFLDSQSWGSKMLLLTISCVFHYRDDSKFQ